MTATAESTTRPRVVPLHADPETRAVALRRLRALRVRRERSKHRRQRIEEKITTALEALEDLRQEFLARLDALQGDPDFEPYGDEMEDWGCVNEPDLGSMSNRWDQRFWSLAGGEMPGLDGEDDARELREASLGWSDNLNQQRLDVGSGDGREDQCEGGGPGENDDINDSGDIEGGSTWPA